MINVVALTGRLTRTPELKQTRSGTAVTSFTIAVNRNYVDKQGNREADFISCLAWRKTAELITSHTDKGDLIGIDGRLQTRTYQDRDGKTVYITEVVVEDFTFLESKNKNQQNVSNSPSTGYKQASSANGSKQNKTAESAKKKDIFDKPGNSIDITDDDLPF